MRSESSHQSELISQLLYGDCFKVISKKAEWLQITTLIDQYTGWIDHKQTQLITEEKAKEISFKKNSYSINLVDYIETSKNMLTSLILGSNVSGAEVLGHEFNGPITKGKKTKVRFIQNSFTLFKFALFVGWKNTIGY
jgi:hypothetical protein